MEKQMQTQEYTPAQLKEHERRRDRVRVRNTIRERKLDMHDLLHSIFWNKPTRAELKPVLDKLNEELQARKVNMMRAEIEEAINMGMGGKY